MKNTNVNKNSLLQSKKKVSGEISKEPFLDIVCTTLEQSTFSLIQKKKSYTEGNSYKSSAFTTNEIPLKKMGFAVGISSRTSDFVSKTKFFQKVKFSLFQEQKSSGCISFVQQSSGKELYPDLQITRTVLCRSKREILFFAGTIKNRAMLRQGSIDIRKFWRPKNQKQAFIRSESPFSSIQNRETSVNSNSEKKAVSRQTLCELQIGDYVHSGDTIAYSFGTPIVIGESGKILKISSTQITIQKMQPVLFYSQAEIHVESSEWVKRGTPILTLAHQTLVTGDIVQGIPRIEQLFEASTSPPSGTALQDFDSSEQSSMQNEVLQVQPSPYSGYKKRSSSVPLRAPHINRFSTAHSNQLSTDYLPRVLPERNDEKLKVRSIFEQNVVYNKLKAYRNEIPVKIKEKPPLLFKTLQSQVRETFRKKWNQFPLPVAVRQSLEEIQQIIVESIQKVYLSQGVLIADKHIEIIVRQMTSKAQIFDGGSTGLLIDEVLSLQQVENANISTPGQKALYIPVVMGLTQAALSSDSFVSAASFQETTRVLSRDAIAGKSDFLRGLKEKVIIGDLIDAGTGLDLFYIYPLFSKKIFENKFREIFNAVEFPEWQLSGALRLQ